MPEQSFEREAKILKNTLQDHEAQELWILGDFIHHPEGLHESLLNQMREWLDKLKTDTKVETIRLIPGNHDKRFIEWAKTLPITVHEAGIIKDAFIFVHDESDFKKEDLYCFSGHLHPAFYPPILGSEKLPCFWLRENKAYLPAFSRMAGGMEIGTQKPEDRVFVIADHQVIEL